MKDAHDRVRADQHLSLEVSEILCSFYFLKREFPESDVVLENLRTLHFVGLLHADIVLRLCKLDEDDARSWSFRQVFKKLSKRSAHSFADADIDRQIRQFHELVRPIRDHRDSYIAHHSKRDKTYLKPPELLPAIRMAIEIIDALAEEPVSYRFEEIDLRKDAIGY
jgi:hypothetical protein